jgi:hypothetical protein
MTEDNVCAHRRLETHSCWAWPDAEERRLHALRGASAGGGRARLRRVRLARLACRRAHARPEDGATA